MCSWKNIGLLLVLFLTKTLLAHDVYPEHHQSISFVENKKQWDERVLFRLDYQNTTLFFEENGITYNICDPEVIDKIHDLKFKGKDQKDHNSTLKIKNHAYKVTFLNISSDIQVIGNEKHPFYHNYYLGNDAQKWASFVSVYKSVTYKNIYKGIDLLYFEEADQLKYEYHLEAGVDPGQIKSSYQGDIQLKLKDGALLIQTSIGNLKELKPIAYQLDRSGNKISVPCWYVLNNGKVSYRIGEYDKSLPLVIDPTLIFSTFTGSFADNWGFTATYDLNGNMYGGGIAFSTGYPTTLGAYQTNFNAIVDVSISKFNETGNALIFSTYLGGNQSELPHSLIVNQNNELYVFGTTGSSNFPITTNSFQTLFKGGPQVICSNSITYSNGSDIFIAKLNQNGSQLLASTYLGGTSNDGLNTAIPLRKNYADEVRGEIILDQNSNVYITSSTLSNDFPTTTSAYSTQLSGSQDAIICKLNHTLTHLIWSTYLGGSNSSSTAGYSISLGENNSVYITGGTNAANLSTSQDAYQPLYAGGIADGFVAHIDPNGASILALTYFGSSLYDQAYLIKTDKYFHPHIVGQTNALVNTFIINAAWHSGIGQFITKFTPALDSVIWSTEFGNSLGGPDISPTALLVDVCNRIYLSGWGGPLINGFGGTSGLPITSDAFQNTTDDNDYYLMCISDDASYLLYGSFFGSALANSREHVDGGTSRFDKQGRIYQAVCAGCGGNSSFPTTPGAYSQTNNSGNCNLAVFKIDFNLPAVVSEFNMPNTVCAPATVAFNNQSLIIGGNTSFFWDFGDGTTSSEFMPTHTYNQAGIYNITLIVHDLGSCNFSDTLVKPIMVLANSTYTLPQQTICTGESIQIGLPPAPQDEVTYLWIPATGLNNPTISNPIATVTSSTTYTLLVSNGICSDTITQTVELVDIDIDMSPVYTICEGDTLNIEPIVSSNVPVQYHWSYTHTFSSIINTDYSTPNLTIYPFPNGTTLYLKVFNGDCEVVQSTMVTISTLNVMVPEPLVVCFGDPIQINLTVNPNNCTFVWSPSEYILSGADSSSPTVDPPTSTTFSVTVTSPQNCQKQLSIPVTVQSGTFLNTFNAWCLDPYIFLGESTLLESNLLSDHEYQYSWTPALHLTTPFEHNTSAQPIVTTLYTLKVTDTFGCFKTDTVTVFVTERICEEPYVYIPNAFTPNGDGNNDILYVRSEILETFTFRIYNRLGELLFETTNTQSGWDGKFKGEKCIPGVYDYYLEGKCNNKEYILKKGNITLIR